jgi:ABC-type glutathione transport system ATPase component
MTTLTVRDLTVSVGQKRLVGPVDFDVEPGLPLAILGETGAGKSVLAQAVIGALPAELSAEGAITFSGTRLDRLSQREREKLWGRSIAILPQEPWLALDPLMVSAAQVAESHAEVAGRSWPEANGRARDDLAALGLAEAAMKARPGTMSGGMAQRVAFAAATAAGARTLLVDEPTKGLDDARRDDVVRLLKAYVAAGGVLITITHEVAVARALGGRAMILRAGEVVEAGTAENVLTAPKSAYGQALVAADPLNWPDVAAPIGGEPVLTADDLAVARGGRTLVEGLHLSIGAGSRLAIAGPSGLGKTSLLDTLAGLIPPAAGRVARHGSALPEFALQKLYQDPPAAFAPRVALAKSFDDFLRRHRIPRQRLSTLLDKLGLGADLLARRPAAVSGGELQRLSLARVLALRPAVILADEPTSRLDPVTQRSVMEVIGEAHREADAAVVVVTHNLTMALRWAGAVVDLSNFVAEPRTQRGRV